MRMAYFVASLRVDKMWFSFSGSTQEFDGAQAAVIPRTGRVLPQEPAPARVSERQTVVAPQPVGESIERQTARAESVVHPEPEAVQSVSSQGELGPAVDVSI